MGGLYIGFGANVGYDEYDARANVGYQPANAIKSVTVDKAINGVALEDGASANNLVTQLWACGKDKTVPDISIGTDVIVSSEEITGQDELANDLHSNNSSSYCDGIIGGKQLYVLSDDVATGDLSKLQFFYSSYYHSASETNYSNVFDSVSLHLQADCVTCYGYTDWSQHPDYYYKTTTSTPLCGHLLDGREVEGYPVQIYKKTGESIQKSVIKSDKATYLMSQSLNRSGHNAGGEMKMAYFHDFGNHIMAGLDLTGAVLSKNKRNVQVSKFNVNDVYPDLVLKSGENQIASAKYKNGQYEATVEGTKAIVANSPLILSVDTDSLKGMHVTSDPIKGEYLDVSNGDKEVSFEKGIFNPKLAFVVGGTYNGWFAGLRAGVSYNTGKIKAPDMTSSKSVSIASPLVGVQVMKKVSDNTNLYMTADWNVGDLRKSVDMNGIKSFKQSSYNISAGVQWRCNFMK